ncbi:MAG TPA: hypothetical protein VKW76_06895 [Candidatus Binatia bacterium]|nr:hypothetical protein [Candidatus Binatia bacterium]
MPTTDERLAALEARVDTADERVAALEAWVDSVVPTLRNLAFRAGEAPIRDAHGEPRPINYVPSDHDGLVRADIRAAVPRRATRPVEE